MDDFNQALGLIERASLEIQQGNPSPDAQNVLLRFQERSSPYDLCKFILEHSKVPTAQFQSVSTIRRAVLREWSALSPQQREGIRDFLLQYLVNNHAALQNFVKAQLLQCVAVLTKREWIDIEHPTPTSQPNPQFKEAFFQKILTLLGGEMHMKRQGVGLLLALVNEFSSKQTNSENKLPVTYHLKCNRSFADKELKQVLTWTMAFIHQFITNPASLQNDAAFLGSCLTLAAQILSWDFDDAQSTSEGLLFTRAPPQTGSSASGDVINAPLRPPSHYRDIFVNSHDILLCFFKLLGMVEQNEDLSHLTRVALSQLASLSGDVFPDRAHQVQYLKAFLELLVPTLRKYTAALASASPAVASSDFGQHMIGLANIVVRLVSNFRLALFYLLPPVPAALDAFLGELCAFTCGCLQSLKSVEEVEFTWNMDCFNYLTDAWLVFVDSYPLLPLLVGDIVEAEEPNAGGLEPNPSRWLAVKGTLQKYTRNVFQLYVEARIAIAHSELEQDLVENEENCDDKREFAEQLEAVGRIGRLDCGHALQLVTAMLGERLARWQGHVQQRNIQGLDVILEELHWLVLITGHLLANEPKDELAHIPMAVNELSDESDAVIAATNAVMAVLQFQNSCLTNDTLDGFDDIVSPLLAETLLWFVSRWCATYLTFHRQKMPVSERLKAAYGATGGMLVNMMQFFFSSISSILTHWSGAEPGLAMQACELLLSLAKLPFRSVLLQLDVYRGFCEAYVKQSAPELNALPAQMHRLLVEALVRMGSGTTGAEENREALEQYFRQVVAPIQADFARVFERSDLAAIAQNAQVMSLIDRLIQSLRGVVRAGKGGGLVARATLHVVLPCLEKVASLLRLYSHRADMRQDIGALFGDLLLFQIDNIKERAEVDAVLKGIYHYAQAVAELTKEKSATAGGKKEEEKQRYREAKQRTLLLYNLFFHFIGDASGPRRDPQVQEQASQLALFLLTSSLLPLISPELMLYPKVRDGYFSVVCGLFEEAPRSVLLLPPSTYGLLLSSLRYALLSTETEVARRGLETLASVCVNHQHAMTHNVLPSAPGQPLPAEAAQSIASGQQVLAELLQLLFDHIILSSSTTLISPDLLPQASTALFGVICCHPEVFKQLVGQVLEKSPAQWRQKITHEFEALVSGDGLAMRLDEANFKRWRKNVVHFLQHTQGLLILSS